MKAENYIQPVNQSLPVGQFTSPMPITTGTGFHREENWRGVCFKRVI